MGFARRAVSAAAGVAISLTAIIGGVAATAAPAAAASPAGTLSGVRMDALHPELVTAFGDWRGAPVQIAHEFLPYGSWADIEGPWWALTKWQSSAYRTSMMWSVGMLPTGDASATLEAGATGAYDGHFVTLAQRLVAAGMGNAYIRPGWELNGSWYHWSAGGHGAAYADYFRHIVTAMRSVPGASFRFIWCVANGRSGAQFYPGDDVVDVVGDDVYDQSWVTGYTDPATRWTDLATSTYGMNYWARFAASHGKRLALPEWGVFQRSDGHGGGDAPYFIDRMHEWIGSHDVELEAYFNRKASDGDHYLGPDASAFPLSAAEYKALWSAAGSDPTAAPTATTAPVTSTGDTGTTTGTTTDDTTTTTSGTTTSGTTTSGTTTSGTTGRDRLRHRSAERARVWWHRHAARPHFTAHVVLLRSYHRQWSHRHIQRFLQAHHFERWLRHHHHQRWLRHHHHERWLEGRHRHAH